MNPETSTQFKLYEQDFYLWLETTAKLLNNLTKKDLSLEEKVHYLKLLDCSNLKEEVEAMGRNEKHKLESNLVVVLMHLLKYKHQPDKRTNSWRFSILEHRNRLKRILRDSPSLKNYLLEVFNECYQDARKEAEAETDLTLNTFPENSPFTVEESLNPDFLPDEEL